MVSSLGSTGIGASASTMAPSRRLFRPRRLALAASKVISSRASMRSANRASISASAIGAADKMRPCAALPASSATARNGSRASGDAASIWAPRPFASKNAPGAPLRHFWRCAPDRRGRAGRRGISSGFPVWGGKVAAISAHRSAMARASLPRRERSRCSAASRSRRSTSLPPRPRSVMIAASSAASIAAPCSRGIDHHAGEPRRQRQPPQMSPFVGDAAVAVDGAELGEQRLRLGKRRPRRRIEEGELFRAAAPGREIEREGRKIGGEDFRAGEGFERGGLRLVPQPVADAGFGAPGAAAALIGGRARHAHGFEPRHADIGLVARHPRQPRIDDDAHALDGDRGFRDRGGQHDLAAAGRRRRDGAILLLAAERAVKRDDIGRASKRFSSWVWVRRISAAPGRKASSEPGSARIARAIVSATCGSIGRASRPT